MQNNSISRYGNPNATQGFIWKEITWPPGLLERKNNNEVVSFYVYTIVDNRERARPNLHIMQAQFDNKPSLSGYTLWTSA